MDTNDSASIVSLKYPFQTFYVYLHPEQIKVYKPFNEDGYYVEELTEEEYMDLAANAIESTQVTAKAFKELHIDIDLPFDI